MERFQEARVTRGSQAFLDGLAVPRVDIQRIVTDSSEIAAAVGTAMNARSGIGWICFPSPFVLS
jgi:hypothetical protein